MSRKGALRENYKSDHKKLKLKNAADIICVKIKKEVMNNEPEVCKKTY
jgi:hypothetical protein